MLFIRVSFYARGQHQSHFTVSNSFYGAVTFSGAGFTYSGGTITGGTISGIAFAGMGSNAGAQTWSNLSVSAAAAWRTAVVMRPDDLQQFVFRR